MHEAVTAKLRSVTSTDSSLRHVLLDWRGEPRQATNISGGVGQIPCVPDSYAVFLDKRPVQVFHADPLRDGGPTVLVAILGEDTLDPGLLAVG